MRYVLGLDIGISSVGFAICDLVEQKIEFAGVHLFERSEVPKSWGISGSSKISKAATEEANQAQATAADPGQVAIGGVWVSHRRIILCYLQKGFRKPVQ